MAAHYSLQWKLDAAAAVGFETAVDEVARGLRSGQRGGQWIGQQQDQLDLMMPQVRVRLGLGLGLGLGYRAGGSSSAAAGEGWG